MEVAARPKKEEEMRKLQLNSFGVKRYTTVPSVLLMELYQTGVTREEMLVLIYLFDKCWGNKTVCHPSVGKMAQKLGYKIDPSGKCTSVKRLLKSLQKKGYVEIEKRGIRKSNQYDLAPCLTKCGIIEKRMDEKLRADAEALKQDVLHDI